MPVYAFNAGYSEFSIPSSQPERRIDVACWYPTEIPESSHKYNTVSRLGSVAFRAEITNDTEQYPSLIHCHGYAGGALVSTELCERFARSGYVVFSLDFADDFLLHPIKGEGMGLKMFAEIFKRSGELYKKREKFEASNHIHRINDLRLLIEFICNKSSPDKYLAAILDIVDTSRIGLVGHSLGAYTSLIVCGATSNQPADPRIKAVLAWSPAIWAWIDSDYTTVSVPVMIQFGKLEPGPRLGNGAGVMDRAFNNLAGPKYLAEIARAGHFAWIDAMPNTLFIKSEGYAQINDAVWNLSIDFLDAYLYEKPAAKQRMADVSDSRVGVSRYLAGNLW